MTSDPNQQRFTHALGGAVVHVWAEVPTEVQEKLFEHAVIAGHRTERDESLREQLAKFLHEHHVRTRADDDGRRAGVPPV
jgi:hypothetical protein